VVRGYDRAAEITRRELADLGAAADGEADLRRVVETAMAGKGLDADRSTLVDLVISAADLVEEDGSVDPEHIRIVTQTGRPVADSKLVDGAVLNDEPLRESMPRSVERGRVLLTRDPVQLADSSLDMNVEMPDADAFSRFLEQEDEQVRNLVAGLVDLGADAVFCSSSIADEAQSALAVQDVLGVRRIDDEALAAAAAVLGGTVVSSVRDATADDLGEGSVTRDEDDELFVVRADGGTRATVLLCAPTEQLAGELQRHVETAIDVLTSAAGGHVVAGGGATEVELARRVRAAAAGTAGREQLAVEAFADAIEGVPRVLAANAGLDPVDALVDLRNAHADGGSRTGVAADGTLIDTFEAGVREPVGVKRQAIASAVEAAGLVLRIDGILTVGELSDTEVGGD
jgi:chaperonin GroEL (HSP60 family)